MRMKSVLLSTAVLFSAVAANAADLPSKKEPAAAPAASADGFDFAFGAKLMSDDINRGVSQTRGGIGATGYGELRYNIGDTQLYFNVTGWNTKTPTDAIGEIDLAPGIRQTWGKFSIDVGFLYYWYPGNKTQYWTNGVPGVVGGTTFLTPQGATGLASCIAGWCATTAANPNYFEIYARPSYNITDSFNLGASIYYSPDWTHYSQSAGGSSGKGFASTYLSIIPKYTFGETGFSVSGEAGYQWLGTIPAGTPYTGAAALKFPSYWSWNAGVSYAWNNITFDLRYFGSNLNKTQCYLVSSDPAGNPPGGIYTGQSGLCGQRIAASISFDLVASKDLKRLP